MEFGTIGSAPIRYAKSGELNIAYQVTGDGPIDLVLVSGFISHLEKDWEEPRHAHFLERLSSFSRLIRFDKRGTGLSDRPGGLPDLETRMDDVRAVMEAVGSERAVLFGYSEGGPMSLLFTATYPERVSALVLFGTFAKRLRSEDYPWARSEAETREVAELVERRWGFEAHMQRLAPSADAALARWWEARGRAAASPGAARALIEMNAKIDVRDVLPTIHVPTLVLHRRDDRTALPDEGRYIAARISGARFVELAGSDHWVGWDPDQIVDEVEEFVTGVPPAAIPDRVLLTILFTDIVASTEAAAKLGDRAWRELLERHDVLARRHFERYKGREIKTTGDGFLAVFDGPARAVRCAQALAEAVGALGLEVRAGVHTGEAELRGEDIGGLAVHIAARVAALAGAGEVLASRTVTDLVAGSGLTFVRHGQHRLKGVPGEWDIYAVR